MKTVAKVIIGGGVALVLAAVLLIVVITGGAVFVAHKMDNPETKAALDKAKAEGDAFGKGTDQSSCMQKGFSLPEPKDSFDISNEEFVHACLKSSRPSPNFCEGVQFKFDQKWFQKQCDGATAPYNSCIHAYIAKRNYCQMDK
ncbi:MAG: hypothetical protein ABI878_00350 [Acidobacteriota bacterium]